MTIAYPSIPGVRFKLVEGFPDYCIGDDGSLWSKKEKCVPSGLTKNNGWHKRTPAIVVGYPQCTLCHGSARRQVKLHVLVLEAFVGPRPEGMQVCHNDGDRGNNHLSNLRWDTPSSNNADKDRHGTHHKGSRNGNAKLDESQAKEIRQLSAEGWTERDVASRYGVSTTLVRFIVRRQNWKHV